MGQWSYRDFALHLAALDEGVHVRPVASEGRRAGKESVLRVAFLVGGHTLRRNRSDPALSELEGADRVRVVHSDLAVLGIDEVAPAVRGDPLSGVAGQTFIRVALEDEAVEALVGLLLAGLDLRRLRG